MMKPMKAMSVDARERAETAKLNQEQLQMNGVQK